jgi:fumarate reductase subunit D
MGMMRREELVQLITGSLSDDKLIQLTFAVGCILGVPTVAVLTLPLLPVLNGGPILLPVGLLQATSTVARLMAVCREPTGHSTLTGTFILW